MKTIRQLVMEALVERTWVSGGTIERYVAKRKSVKPSTVGRQLREFAQMGYIKKRLVGKVKKYVEYKR